jgi:hypothetical protein
MTAMRDTLVERAVLPSARDLLGTADERVELRHGDSKSGARLERVRFGEQWFVAKWLDARTDWTMRAVGDLGCTTRRLWSSGLLDALPSCIDQPIVAVAHDDEAPAPGAGCPTVLLMRDVGPWLVPEGDATLPLEQHRAFVDHMAQLHARFWGFDDQWELITTCTRYFEVSPWTAVAETAIGSDAPVPKLVAEGWARLGEVAPRAADAVVDLAYDPSPLAAALERTPLTFVHGNWKLGNLGFQPDGRTILIDWESPGAGPACGEMAWYLALNCRRLPETKEATIDAFRAALERHGIDTSPWWDVQCALALLGGLVHFGWEKALGGYDDELAWWEERAVEGRATLARCLQRT